jgi:hypothetical protein
MKNDDSSIFDGIVKLLEETKHLHNLEASERATIATLVQAIARSDRVTRGIFYTEATKIAEMLSERQEEQRKEAGKILRKYRSIWGDEELGEDICKLLDEEDAKPTDIDSKDSPKKKVIN